MKRKILSIIYVVLFSALVALIIKWKQTGNPFRMETVLVGTVILVNTIIVGILGYNIFRKFVKKSTAQIKKQLLPTFLLFTLAAFLISIFLVSLGVFVYFVIHDIDTKNFFNHLIQVELGPAIKQFAVWILVGSSVLFYIIWRIAIDAEQALREENLQFRYRSLKSQVNPHFLFNSLNTLSELVYDDAKRADDYIQKLSGIYRYILENEETELVTVKNELDFIQQYVSLQEKRDEGKIKLEIDVDVDDHCLIIPVSLQLLIENAIKHNSMSKEKPLVIRVYKQEDCIVVENNKQIKSTLENSTKTGLNNLKERVRLFLNSELVVEETDKSFVVKVPIISVK